MSSSKAPSCTIREMEFNDLQAVFKIGETLFTAGKWRNLYRTWDEYEILERFINEKEFCLVAETEKDQIVGFAIGSLIEKRKSAWKYGYLIWIGILPEFSRQKLGARLLRKITKLFTQNGARIMIADTESKNKNAINFLKKHQFTDAQEHIYLSKNLK